jgi:CheY-like chemotaxis protein
LVVDDSRTVLESIRGILMTEGYDVRIALDLPSAARQVRGCDLCIVDLHMPGLDGNRLLVALKAAVGGPCVFYLYTSDGEAAKRAKAYGFDGSFMKKGDTALLCYQVSAVFRSLKMAKLGRG